MFESTEGRESSCAGRNAAERLTTVRGEFGVWFPMFKGGRWVFSDQLRPSLVLCVSDTVHNFEGKFETAVVYQHNVVDVHVFLEQVINLDEIETIAYSIKFEMESSKLKLRNAFKLEARNIFRHLINTR